MKLKDVTTLAPGLDFFYLRTDENGKLYIDNAYSQFNQSNMETSTQADVQALINDFEQADDVLALQTDVQAKYEEAVASDSKLDTMANKTIPDAISVWVESLTQTAEDGEDTADQTEAGEGTESKDDSAENGDSSDTNDTSDADNTASEETDSQETVKENSDGKAKTAYAMEAVNIRKGRSTSKKVVTQVPLGGKLKIYPDTLKNGWVKATYDGKTGYVKREYVTTKRSKVPDVTASSQETGTAATALSEGKEVTLSDSVNVRASMSETSDRVGLAFQGDVVKVIQSYAEGWTKVEWNGQTGYIKTDLIK
jgi:uncharacterized protein YgiM (DUF1202 family)